MTRIQSISSYSFDKYIIFRWFMPVNIFISCAIGSLLGYILVKITKTPPHLKGLVIACSSAGNMISSVHCVPPCFSLASLSLLTRSLNTRLMCLIFSQLIWGTCLISYYQLSAKKRIVHSEIHPPALRMESLMLCFH